MAGKESEIQAMPFKAATKTSATERIVSHIQHTEYQNIYNFWLSDSINSNESMYNIRKIVKRSFSEQYPN